MPVAITPPDPDLQAPYFVPGGQAVVGPETYDVPTVRTNAIRDMLDQQAAQRAQQFDAMQARAREAVNEQIQMREWMDQNRMANDQLKNIQAARRFMATRRLGNDIEDAVAAGVPREVAVANGIMRNLDALGGNLSPLVSASHAATIAARPQPDIGGVSVVTDPATGKRMGVSFRGGPQTARFVPDVDRTTATMGQRIQAKSREAAALQAQLRDEQAAVAMAPKANRDKVAAGYATIRSRLDKVLGELHDLGAGMATQPEEPLFEDDEEGGGVPEPTGMGVMPPAVAAPAAPAAPARVRSFNPKTRKLE